MGERGFERWRRLREQAGGREGEWGPRKKPQAAGMGDVTASCSRVLLIILQNHHNLERE